MSNKCDDMSIHIRLLTSWRTSRGGAAAPPPNIWAVRFFGQWRKFGRKAREGIFGKNCLQIKKIFLCSHLRPAKNKWLKFEEFMVSWRGLVCCQNLPQWYTSLQWYLLHLVQRNDRLVHFVYWKLTYEAPWDSSVSHRKGICQLCIRKWYRTHYWYFR